MSNDLSANMRRSEMWRREDDRRVALHGLIESMKNKRDVFYIDLTAQMDTYAEKHGCTKKQMVDFAISLGMLEFAAYYHRVSTAFDDGKI